MAISSTSSATNASIDVASIVSQLMSAESKPIDRIDAKIATQKVVISDLGVIKSKVAALQDALTVFEDINTYGNMSASSDNTAIVTATAGTGAAAGTYAVTVAQVAQKSTYNITGLASATDAVNFTTSSGFQITVGTTVYSSDGSKTVAGVTTANAIAILAANPTATTLKDWINSVSGSTNVTASLSQMTAGHWSLVLNGTQEGLSNDFSISGLQTGASIRGFTASTDLVLLDQANGFQLTADGVTYKTGGAGSNVTAIVGTGMAGAVTLGDLVTWINARSTANTLGLTAAIVTDATGASLEITQAGNGAKTLSIAGVTASSTYPTVVSRTQGISDETATFTFPAMRAGDSITIAGLTMTAKMDLTAAQSAASFNALQAGATAPLQTSILNGKTSDPVSGGSTVSLSNVALPTDSGVYRLTSVGAVLTMTKYVSGSAVASSSIELVTSGSGDSTATPPKALFAGALNGVTTLSFGSLGSFNVNTSLAATNVETASEIAAKIVNASAADPVAIANAWISVPGADWAETARTNLSLGASDLMKAVITTTGSTKLRIGAATTTALTEVYGYANKAAMDDGLVTELAFVGTAAQLNSALATLEANSPDGLGKISINIVPSDIISRSDSVTGDASYYKVVSGSIGIADATTAASSSTFMGLTGFLTNITSQEENDFIRGKVNTTSWIGANDAANEGKWVWGAGPEAGVEFYATTNPTNKRAIPSVTLGTPSSKEIRTWDFESTNSSTLFLANARSISFQLVNPADDLIDTVVYNNSSGTTQSITTVLTNLKAYFDAGSDIDATGVGYSINGTKASGAAGTLGLFSEYDFSYSVAADSLSASLSFTGKVNGVVTDGALSDFQIRGINLYSNWATGEPNDSGGNEDYANFSQPQGFQWNDLNANPIGAYVVEYNASSGSAVLNSLKREFSLPIPGVIEVGNPASVAVGNALNYANFSGALTGFSSVVNGNDVILTSSTAGSDVSNISSSFVNRAASSSSTLTIESSTAGSDGVNELWTFNFSALKAGDAVTLTEASDGGSITFTANQDLTAEKVAQAFAGIAAGTTKTSNLLGTFSGTNIASYASGLADGSKVTFTASVDGDAANLSGAIVGRSVSTTTFSAPTISDGGAAAQESVQFKFAPAGIKSGDSITIGGLTFTAGRALTTAELSGAFASLANNATTGAGSSYGSYSGSLSGYSSGAVISGDQVLFTSTAAAGTNVTDLTASSVIRTISGTGLTVNQYTTARNAQLSIGGIAYERSSNSISDIYSGVTFNLMGTAGTTNVKVILGADNTEKSITDLKDAYNDLIKTYSSMTANSANSSTPGTFANNPTTLSFIEGIKRRFATGLTYNIGTNNSEGDPYTLSLASLGLDYQLDGTLKYNAVSYLMSQSAGLREKFLKGIKIGYTSATDTLATFVKAQSSSLGALSQQIQNESNQVNSLTKEKENIQNRLNKVQESYIAQYSGLNALLFQLNSTSTSLGNALDSLTNMNSNK
ncbi:flagellar filament capping protein FliD [Polynucleobacter sp. AM-7D1]|uniref:flagellar filament capping protein FliD n=1 Tax=Polynucleobacter sp. AM-7D1 TaxID=2689102 RepID=UPI001BFDCE0D|nr:flagellar filament capping protein FliD [Polynucleobacter sp. AM-7D1]QWE29102.1 flagellar filament capping protein FliD [Polynucleobacter sp. AM-7D1]